MSHEGLLAPCSCLVALLVLGLTQRSAAAMRDVADFFPEIDGDLTLVTWGHAVNSQSELDEAIKENLMMLEADVVLGTLKGAHRGPKLPVMGHPPATTSDLSLEEFLTRVTAAGRRGVKLDFKSTQVLVQSLEILKEHEPNMNFPVWLNADILRGPVNSTVQPVDADYFLQHCQDLFPGSTLSVGWTTRYGNDIPEGKYSKCNVHKMKETLARNHVNQPLTFPVRAALAARSLDTLPGLLDVPGVDSTTTLTVWTSSQDAVDLRALSQVIQTVGKHRVYVDMPRDVIDQLNKIRLTSPSAASTSGILAQTMTSVTLCIASAWRCL